ncbi:hypothetical protein E4U56_004385 [Claviceps arundinis]|uniref:Uncharacterized protein n=1 Tax=Claviceps arundinis TaxID=1623583 RepID=A0A9P7MNC7_9HYPO|nr:hypothetical protein E4U56_004385 [Claviceps arundinis]
MNAISTPSQTAQTSASAEVDRGLIDYLPLVDHLQQSNNLPAVQDDAQYAQMKTRLDVFGNRLTDVGGPVIAIQGIVRAIRDDVKGLRDDIEGLQDGVTGLQDGVTGLQGGVTNNMRVVRENIGRQVDSLCKMISNVDSRSNKSRQDEAEVKVKVNIKLKTSNKTGLEFQGAVKADALERNRVDCHIDWSSKQDG